MAILDLNTEYVSKDELETIKQRIMLWYSSNEKKELNCFYKDAFEDLLGKCIYGQFGEYMKASMLLNSWIRDAYKQN